MFTTYIKMAFRHLRKNPGLSVINLFGLAFGLAAAFAVLLYINDELSYERFHQRADRIVRAEVHANFDGSVMKLGMAPNYAAPFLKGRIPEIEQAVRVFPHNFGESASLSIGNQNFVEERFFWADPELFEVFSIHLLAGDPSTALVGTNKVVLSNSAARRYFGNADPLGRIIKVDNSYDLEVSGVFEDLPPQTHLPLQVVGAFPTIPFGQKDRLSWGNASFFTYFLLGEKVEIPDLELKIARAITEGVPEDRQWFELKLRPLLEIHLHSGDLNKAEGGGDINQIWILFGLAVVLVLIACINYMNLATARSQQRSKEVAVNKAVGASVNQMAGQFFTEAAMLALVGIGLSLIILQIFLPFFNGLTDKHLSLMTLADPFYLAGVLAIWLLITFIAGSYPALYLSSFSLIEVLRHSYRDRTAAGKIRKGLVVFQFCISIALIISTVLLYQQLNFIRSKKLGFDPEQVVAIRVKGMANEKEYETLEKEIGQVPAVLHTALSQSYPGHTASGRTLALPEAPEDQSAELRSCRAYPGIFEVLGLELITGRPMKVRVPGDSITQIVLNRSAVQYLGWSPEEALGKRVRANLGTSEIVGVCEDFHFTSLHQQIGFYAFHNRPSEWLQYLLVKLKSEDLFRTLDQLKSSFSKVSPNVAFEFTFIDDKIEALYRSEQRLAKVVFIFAGLAIFIACLGLFALAAFATEQRTREIGIRKVLGATSVQIVKLLSKDFLKLVALAFLLAAPVSWWAMEKWLQDFAYRITPQWWVFVLAGLISIIIAFFTVSYQSLKAALSNPVEALRRD